MLCILFFLAKFYFEVLSKKVVSLQYGKYCIT